MTDLEPSHQDLLAILRGRDAVPDAIPIKNHTYQLEGDHSYASGLFSVVWKARDEHGRARAIKFKLRQDNRGESYLSEVYRACALESCDCFARFIDASTIDLPLNGHVTRVTCFVEEWVNGSTLETYLHSHAAEITSSFMLAYIKGMCTALHALYEVDLRYGDLHDRNVMIATPGLGDLSSEWKIKVIDTGSLSKPTVDTEYDDHFAFVNQLVTIWNAIHARRGLVIRERRFLNATVPLLRHMLEDDRAIALRAPAQILEQFQNAYTRAMRPPREEGIDLKSPFEFISADHIADDRLLVDIFPRSCPWLEKVSGPDPCLVTGPRGCGKSTIFRWLSLKTHLEAHPNKEAHELDNLRISGFYISCSSDLQNRLSWLRTSDLATRHRNFIIHYFNLIAVREIIRTLVLIAHRKDREVHWGFGAAQEVAVADFIEASITRSRTVRLRGMSRIEQTQEIVEAELFLLHQQMRDGKTVEPFTTAAFLGDVTALLSYLMPLFMEKKIVFLVDDFSVHRLPEPVQTVLNQVIWERRPTHVFKLSSEKHGAMLTDELLASSELTRERLEIDCGQEFLALDDSKQQNKAQVFAMELLDNRLRAAGYMGSAEVLIGKSEWDEGSLAKALVNRTATRHPGQYHGLRCIAQLCSGDVASLLLVYSTIFSAGHITRARGRGHTAGRSGDHQSV